MENGNLKGAESPEQAETRYYGNHTWDNQQGFPRPQGSDSVFPLPTSLPEIPSAVSPNPRESETPHSTAREKWRKAMEVRSSSRFS